MRARTDDAHICNRCDVRDRALCSALPDSVARALTRIARYRWIPARQIIQGQHEVPRWFATVMSGVIKLMKVQHDGRRQIVGLQFPSDFFGRPYAHDGSLVAGATTNVELCCFSRAPFERLMQEHPQLRRALLRRAFDDLDASRKWMQLLSRKSARQRVASLVALIAPRLAQSESTALQFNLPLSRIDIADMLGLRLETVSREIHCLKSQRLIDLRGTRTILIPKFAALQRVAEGDED